MRVVIEDRIGDPVGGGIQLAIAELLIAICDGDIVVMALNDVSELVMNKMPVTTVHGGPQRNSRKVISIFEGVLPFGSALPITLQVYATDKVHLMGKNGSGKSTLLKTILGKQLLRQGELQLNTPLHYLDQHFGVICPNLSILDNLIQHCEGMKESDARTLLAGIGFRRDSVFKSGSTLSGGEKMKLAMLIVSHQRTQPLLLLDEPDNHLDLDSKMMLAQALNGYRGGFILVSHDQEFANGSGITRQIGL